MAEGAGYCSRCGLGLESLAGTWGTLVAPTILLPIVSSTLDIKTRVLENNTLIDKIGKESPTKVLEWCEGELKVRASYRNSEYLIYAALAGLEAKTGASSPYTHTFDIGDASGDRNFGRDSSFIIEKQANCWNFAGCKHNTFSLEVGPDGVYWTSGIIGKVGTIADTHRAALQALSYTESNPMLFMTQLVFRIADCADALQSTDAVDIDSLTLTLDNKLQTDLAVAGSSYIAEPVPNGKPELPLTFNVPRLTATTLADAMKAMTKLQADLTFTGPSVGGGTYSMTIQLPTVYITEISGDINDDSLITVPVTCMCCRNDSNSNMAETNAIELVLKNAGDSALAWTA